MKKKVIEFITDMGDGGAEALVKDYSLLINKEKFDIVILTRYLVKQSSNIELLKANNIRMISINKSNSFFAKVWNKLTFSFRIPIVLGKILEEEKPDVLHIHLSQLKYVRKAAKKLKGVSLIYTCHNIVSHYFGKDIKERRAAEYLIKNNGLQLVALHEDMRRELNELFGINNTVIIKNGIDFNRYTDIKITKSEKRKELMIPERAFVLGHVGRFAEQKNHMFLVDVFKEVKKMNSDAYLLMIGAGDTKPVVDKLNECGLEESYQILSHRADVPELMRAMDVFVFPSLYEGLGIALIEAQVSDLRCIVADTVPKDAVQTEKCIVLPLGDAKLWADAVTGDSTNAANAGRIEEWNMREEIKRLERLYFGEKI